MSKATQPIITAQDDTALEAHVGRFKVFHGLVCKSALELKLAKYYAGLEVHALCDLHEEMHGQLRGRPAKGEIPDSLSGISLEAFLEERLGVTARTARRYRGFFQSIASEAPDTADKLNATWHQLTGGEEAKALPKPAEVQTALMTAKGGKPMPEEVLQVVCKHSDEWGLHELFEMPQRDVTPPAADPDEDNDSGRKKAEKAALLKFWAESLVRRLENEELHRLPAPALEAVITKMEEAAKKAREVLAGKTAKKKGKK
jgi:hypothetical protein